MEGSMMSFEELVAQVSPVLYKLNYEITHQISFGAFSTVIGALSYPTRTKVAIKIMSKSDPRKDFTKKFMLREMAIVKTIKHPNIIKFLQTIESTTKMFIVMEDASYSSILDIVQRYRNINEQLAAIWFSQMCDGISFCHSRGIVHRDLKCENVLLDKYKNVKIIDFGFGKTEMNLKSLCSTCCGSYAYASPEILYGIKYIPQYSDVWSLGVILYIMVEGRVPFSDSNIAILPIILTKGVKFGNVDLSKDLQALILNILTVEHHRIYFPIIKASDWMQRNYLNKDDAQEVLNTVII